MYLILSFDSGNCPFQKKSPCTCCKLTCRMFTCSTTWISASHGIHRNSSLVSWERSCHLRAGASSQGFTALRVRQLGVHTSRRRREIWQSTGSHRGCWSLYFSALPTCGQEHAHQECRFQRAIGEIHASPWAACPWLSGSEAKMRASCGGCQCYAHVWAWPCWSA